MSDPLDPPTTAPGALPVLTEELEPVAGASRPPAVELSALDARAIEEEVMAELSQRIDLMFEYRLREALAPTLARAAELLIREAREEVALTLRDVVSRAVAQQLARRRIPR